MRIQDYDSVCDVTNPADIEAALSKRHDGGINSFWLSHGTELFPTIGMLVKGSLANVHYIPKDRDAGFTSVAKMLDSRFEASSLCARLKRFGYGTVR